MKIEPKIAYSVEKSKWDEWKFKTNCKIERERERELGTDID